MSTQEDRSRRGDRPGRPPRRRRARGAAATTSSPMSRSQRRRRHHRRGSRRGAGRRGVHHRRGHRPLARAGGGHGVLHRPRPATCRGRRARRRASGSSSCRSSASTASPAGYGAAKLAHEQAMLAGPIPARVLRAAQFHEFVAQLVEWGTQGDVAYVPRMRTQLVAARTVAEALADLATASTRRRSGAPILEIAGPREESLVEMATLLAARRGDPARDRGGRATRPTPTPSSTRPAPCSPARTPSWPARRSRSGSTRRPEHYPRSARSASPRRSSAAAIHGSATGSSAPQRLPALLVAAPVAAGSSPSGSAAPPGRRRTPRPRGPRRRGARAAAPASCAPVLTPCAASAGRSGSRSGYR